MSRDLWEERSQHDFSFHQWILLTWYMADQPSERDIVRQV
jgi:hypothetical protein